jgi:pheromone shutdown protein TraB
MNDLNELLTPWPWYAWVAIVAIVGAFSYAGVDSALKAWQSHEERMERLRRGLPPEV